MEGQICDLKSIVEVTKRYVNVHFNHRMMFCVWQYTAGATVCVCLRARARARACVCVCNAWTCYVVVQEQVLSVCRRGALDRRCWANRTRRVRGR